MDKKRIKELQSVLMWNSISKQEAEEALELHLAQLQRLGATLEDSVCSILRKLIKRAEAIEELKAVNDNPFDDYNPYIDCL